MTKLTKADIDGLVDGLVANGALQSASSYGLASDLYLAAGLQADGSAKPERVRVDMVVNPEYPNDRHFWESPSDGMYPDRYRVTPGTFIPDGAE